MIELLLVPAAGLTVALFGEKFKSKNDDKRKIQVFFEVAGIAIKRNNEDKLQYPKFQKQIDDDRSTTYVYTLPLGMPSKIIQKVEDVVSEGLNKPVRIQYDNYKLNIRVFRKEIPKNWSWSMDLVTKGKWRIPVGQSLETIVYHDFDETPHMAVGGLIRMGKTVFLKNMFASLSLANPDHAHFYLIDLKEEGLEFSEYKKLKQVEQIVETSEQAHGMLLKVMEKMHERGKYMKERGIKNIVHTKEKDRYFIVVDEGAVLAPAKGLPRAHNKMLEECQYMISHIARVGGALGFRIVFCTQYPTGDTLPRVVKQMANAKLGFRLPTRTASEVVIDQSGLEQLPSIPGRAIYMKESFTVLQVPYIDDIVMWKHLKEYEVEKHEHPEPYENQPSDGDTCDD
ncbi:MULTISPECIES: FtsK/SpoIIIE domain-containing protein [Bacillus]|uniref:FtsK/SpoIIIE domain-containing protein n=1 Tax=Bacillus paranthracis TaxID=2026186 RepID=A0AAX3QGD1_9BACI|nr:MULTISPECIES: FtsK/SpoIIIE domain-containing protein [Bacillus cereus group]EEK44787.1 FtsK/SpoIIIE ATPase [Bacillus cereus m1293]PFN32124.1 cell division protein FtsK [Bacillus cereus]MBE7118340.1 cell division protein FtsK [Bacillus paranthracis]MBE7134221.1 cell division protein FtsK [Bacillus paranthracis]MBE7155736.1 cell division protein FtsK [Bacillus paranthracis]